MMQFSSTNNIGREDGLFMRIVNGISMSVMPLIRFAFGVRYFKLWDIVYAFIVAKIYEIIAAWFGMVPGPEQWDLFPWYLWTILALSILHYVWIMQRERAWQQGELAEPDHSMQHGVSWLDFIPQLEELGFNSRRRLRILEPGLVAMVGWWLRPLDPLLGTWLLIAGVALFIKNNRTLQRWVHRERDQQDALILARRMNRKAQQSNQPAQRPGQTVRPATVRASGQHSASSHDTDESGLNETLQEVLGDHIQDAAIGLSAAGILGTAMDGPVDALSDGLVGDEDG